MIVSKEKFISQGIILASSSLRRAQLLEQVGIQFEIIPSNFDESSIWMDDPVELVQTLALKKAEFVECSFNEQRIILAADTIVVVDGKILGKPVDDEEASTFLQLLSGRTHEVYTGVCLMNATQTKKSVFYVKTEVTMSKLNAHDIAYYISTKEPCDKAGAYGIQGIGAQYISKIHGDFYNVVGLPLNKVIEELKALDY